MSNRWRCVLADWKMGALDAVPTRKKTILLKLQIKLVLVQFKVEILQNYALIIYCQLTDLKE